MLCRHAFLESAETAFVYIIEFVSVSVHHVFWHHLVSMHNSFTVKVVYGHCFFFFSCSLIFGYYSGKDPNSKDNSVGLQLLGIVLANDLPPYDPACGIEHDR